jgi:serine/threonine-protein kinase
VKRDGEAGDSTTLRREGEPTSARLTSGSSLTAADLIGARIRQFHVVARLGAGGMGTVYKALDEKLRRFVAVKVLGPRYLSDERNKALILREARNAAAVSHPNVAAIYQVDDAGDVAFIAMELVEGRTLRARIGEGPVAPGEALRIGLEIARGLDAAHRIGVVHRDLKPDNVMLTADGRVKLLDFGVAQALAHGDVVVAHHDGAGAEALELSPTVPATGSRTHDARVVGTPAYMAPEQARGEPVDARADVFSFGALFYEMLAGARPFAHRDKPPSEWGDASSSDWKPQAALREKRPDVPRDLDAVIARCLDPRPDNRYANATELVRALSAVESGGRRRRAWGTAGALLPAAALVVGSAFALKVAPSGALPASAGNEEAAVEPQASAPLRFVDHPAPQSPSQEALAEYRAALQAFQDGTNFFAPLQRALALDPALAPAHLRLAIWTRSGRPDLAQEHLAQVVQNRQRLSERDAGLLAAVEADLVHERADPEDVGRILDVLAAKYASDVEIQFLRCTRLRDTRATKEGVACLDAVVDLDPTFALALWSRAGARALMGDFAGARADVDRCLALSPEATVCYRMDHLVLDALGDCAGAEAATRQSLRIDPRGYRGYDELAGSLAAQRQPEAAVDEALARKWALVSEDRRALVRAFDEHLLASLSGDFDAALRHGRKVDDALSSATSKDAHASAAYHLAMTAEEAGMVQESTRIARDFWARRAAWSDAPWRDSEAGTTGAIVAIASILARAGALSQQDVDAVRTAYVARGWKAAQTTTPAMLWVDSFARPAETRQEAVRALEEAPAEGLPSATYLGWNTALIGKVYVLAERFDEAVPWLRQATKSCIGLRTPIAYVRAWADLGRALEGTGDRAGACDAYAEVERRWGHAKPRSVTAGFARTRSAALACPRP